MFGANRPAFGGASRPFGTTSSPFGSQAQQQPQQQQQQQPSSTFGLNTANNVQSGFGGFGAAQNTTATTNPSNTLFGMSNSSNTSNGPFGKTVTGGVTSNSSGSLFGNAALGSSGSTVGSVSGNAGSGTAIKSFAAYQEKDPTTGVVNVFQTISAMPEYRNFSIEELRMQDYQAGRKFPSANSNVAGTVSPFGAQTTNTNTGFGTIGNNNSMQLQSAGSGGLFGQRNTTSQDSPFGSLTSSNNTNNTSNTFGSGAFGANSNANTGFGNTSNSPFGLNKPAGGGLFGQSQNSGSTGFGQQSTAFGGTGNAFGNTNAMGNTGGLFGQSNQQQPQQGFGSQAPNTFGQNNPQGGSMFGQNTTSNTGGLFGQQQKNQAAGGLFGNKPSGGLFGQQSSTFGSTNTGSTGLFGQTSNQQQPQSGGLFGQSSATQPQQGGGLFGQSNTMNQPGGLFGQNTSQQSGGMFGQNSNQQRGLFGQTNAQVGFGQQQATSTAGPFGSKPSGGLFGQPQTSTGFGANTGATGGGLFGQSSAQPTQAGGGLFGQQQGAVGQATQQQPGGLFGAKPATGGLFGNQPNQAGGSLFGSTQQQPQGSGLFGQSNQTQQQSGGLFGSKPAGAAGGGLFGSNASTTNQAPLGQPSSGGLFGAKPPTGGPTNTASGGLFGNVNATNPAGSVGGGLFGGTSANNTSVNTGLFGSKPQGQTSGGLFGNNLTGNSTSTSGVSGGLFGSKPETLNTGVSGGGLFGNNSSAVTNNLSGGLFGNKPQQGIQQSSFLGSSQPLQQQQPQQLQSQASNPYGTNDLFSRVVVPNSITQPTKPSATKVNADLKKKANLTGAYRLAPKPLFTGRSLADSTRTKNDVLMITGSRAPSTTSAPSSAGKESVTSDTGRSLFSAETDEAILSADKLLFNPDKKSFKNLMINRKKLEKEVDLVDKPSEVKRIAFAPHETTDGKALPDGLTDGRENLFDQVQDSPTVNKDQKNKKGIHSTKKSGLSSTTALEENGSNSKLRGVIGDDITFTANGYYISPSLDSLASKTLPQLRKVSGLVIGHKDYGKIEFLEPVDLSNIPLPWLCGKIICFEPRACIAYPNSNNPPAEGEGINVRSRISLYKCYPSDKATREPIKDASHQLVKRHIEKMKKQKNAKFESYDPVTGCWTFIVQHPAC
ncbi:hypothetical protein HG536_0G00760 [Torulaspora globosa]|uniref:Peptidase S59 domain-containing protein n=1 Tax=Torulaspora globosa TaxID=48254 RepID=A0A7G3ZL33_9SACH|nr:uncharacterized protein HG536_0G00760 [Torulaspora globosa]QLL34219.1 hypothetical protein HG536_0G00760 [Torulaspora globosa]